MIARHICDPKPRWVAHGFTLVEVLVALAIIAIALGTGLKATQTLVRQAQRQGDQWLAQLCAENELSRLRLAAQMPAIGTSSTACEQAGQAWTVNVTVSPTPNPSFRRVRARVSPAVEHESASAAALEFSTVLGRY